MDFWKSIAGQAEVELTSAEPGAALGAINARGIEIYSVEQVSDLTCRFYIHRSDYRALRTLSEKRGETLKLLRRNGLYWSAKSLLNRPLLLFGMALFLAFVLYLPTRILFVRVEGNESVPAKKILAAAEESGICFGASRREVRSEKMKNALLAAVPELQWAGVNTSGCVAIISVRERSIEEEKGELPAVSSIVASRDGYIVSATVTRGNSLCSIGQAVKEGQLLISGYTDAGICIRATRAEGEIYAQTNRNLTVITPLECLHRGEITQMRKKYSLLIGKKRINLWKDSGIWDASCGRMYEEYYVTLPGGFQLPIALCVEEYISYESEASELPREHMEQMLSAFAEQYLQQQMIAGTIMNRTQVFSEGEGICRLKGKYVCTEMIGRERQEQIGDTDGKND